MSNRAAARTIEMPGWRVTGTSVTSSYVATMFAEDQVTAFHHGDCIHFKFLRGRDGVDVAVARAAALALALGPCAEAICVKDRVEPDVCRVWEK